MSKEEVLAQLEQMQKNVTALQKNLSAVQWALSNAARDIDLLQRSQGFAPTCGAKPED